MGLLFVKRKKFLKAINVNNVQLQENFGFIETLDHDEEVFFHFSNFYGNTNNLELGQEVEYSLSTRGSTPSGGNCLPAENVKIVPKGTINQPKIHDGIYNGVVSRPLRCINPDQAEYCGVINLISDAGEVVSTHEFGITSLVNKRDLLQKNDAVSFKLDARGRAAEVSGCLLVSWELLSLLAKSGRISLINQSFIVPFVKH